MMSERPDLILRLNDKAIMKDSYVTFKFENGDEAKIGMFIFDGFKNIREVLSLDQQSPFEIKVPTKFSKSTLMDMIVLRIPDNLVGLCEMLLFCNYLGFDSLSKSLYYSFGMLLSREEMLKLRIVYFGPIKENDLAFYYWNNDISPSEVLDNDSNICDALYTLEHENIKNILLHSKVPLYRLDSWIEHNSYVTNISRVRYHQKDNLMFCYYSSHKMIVLISFLNSSLAIEIEYNKLNDNFKLISNTLAHKYSGHIFLLYHNLFLLFFYANYHKKFFKPLYDLSFTDDDTTFKIYNDNLEEYEPILPYQDYPLSVDLWNEVPFAGRNFICKHLDGTEKKNNKLITGVRSFLLKNKTDDELKQLANKHCIYYVNYDRTKLLSSLAHYS